MKKLTISLLGLLCAHEALADHGGSFGGGFATGAILGTGLTLAATSGGREKSPEYYESREASRKRSEIKRQIKQHERKIRTHERALKKRKYSTPEEISDHKKAIETHQAQIDDLNDELINI